MVTLNEEQLKWKMEHHASVNPKNFTARKKVIEAFLKDFTVLDQRFPQYVHKPFLTGMLDSFDVRYGGNEHKAVLWDKIQRYLKGESLPKQSEPKKSIKKSSVKKVSLKKSPETKSKPKPKPKSEPELKQKHETPPVLSPPSKQPLSCTKVLQELLSRYQNEKTLPSLKQLETHAKKMLHEAEPKMAHSISVHALASLQAHARMRQEPLHVIDDNMEEEDEKEDENDETETYNDTDEDEVEEPKKPIVKTKPSVDENKISFRNNFELFAQQMNTKEWMKAINDIAPNYDFMEVWDVLVDQSHRLHDVTKFNNLYEVLLQHSRYILRRSFSEFPENSERDNFATSEFVTLLKKFKFAKAQIDVFLTNVAPRFPPKLIKRIVRHLFPST